MSLFSFEFFPSRDQAAFGCELAKLQLLSPDWVSMTCGAGGSNRESTVSAAAYLSGRGQSVTAHLTCRGASRAQIDAQLAAYAQAGIGSIMALRGDKPWEGDGHFEYASDLVHHIRENYPHFRSGVAAYPDGHPATPNRLRDLEYLKAKVDAGADFIVTQLCFDNYIILDFIRQCRLLGIEVPIYVGIMPITSHKGLLRMAELAGRCNFPAALLKAVQRAREPEQVRAVGTHWAAEQIRGLLDHNVDGIHIYTLNQAATTLEIFEKLGGLERCA